MFIFPPTDIKADCDNIQDTMDMDEEGDDSPKRNRTKNSRYTEELYALESFGMTLLSAKTAMA